MIGRRKKMSLVLDVLKKVRIRSALPVQSMHRRFLSAAKEGSKSHLPLQGRPFMLTPKEALKSFESWYSEFVPAPLSSATVTSVRPILVPFYGFYVDSGKRRISAYGGYEFSEQQVEALKVDPRTWTKFDSDLLDKPNLLLDTWSITAAQAAAKASLDYPGFFHQGITPTFSQALLPGYLFEYSRRGQTFKVLIGAETGKASGLRHYSFFTGLREAFSFGLNGSNPFLFFALLIPRLIPPVGLGLILWSFFRAYVSPSISLGVEKLVARLPISARSGRAGERVDRIIADQWGHFDPKESSGSSTYHEREREFFREWMKKVEEVLRESQQQQQSGQQQQQYQQQRNFDWESFFRQQQQNKRSSSSSSSSSGGGGYSTSPPPSQSDPYKVLGVSQNATSDELRQAFRKKLLQYHPDHFQGKDPEFAKNKTQEIVEAYRSISGSAKKSR